MLHLFAAVFLFWNTTACDTGEDYLPVATDSQQLFCLVGQDFSPDFPALETPALQLAPYFPDSRNREMLSLSNPAISGLTKGFTVYPAVGWQSQAALQTNVQRERQLLFPFHFFL